MSAFVFIWIKQVSKTFFWEPAQYRHVLLVSILIRFYCNRREGSSKVLPSFSLTVAYLLFARGQDCLLHRPVTLYSLRQKVWVAVLKKKNMNSFKYKNQVSFICYLVILKHNFHKKRIKVCIKTKSTSDTKLTTVKWLIYFKSC